MNMPPTCSGAIMLLLSIVLLSHSSSATIDAPTELLSKATCAQISSSATWSCCSGSGPCVQSSCPSCAFDGNSATRWTLMPGQRKATITVDLNQGSIIDHFEVSFDASSVIPSSVAMTLYGNNVTWTTYNNKSCQPNERHLRNNGSLYYSCTSAGLFWNASVPLGLFSVRNGSNGWLWWRTFSQLQLTIEASDADFNGQAENSSIVIADIQLFGWNQNMGGCNCHPVGVENADVPCNSDGTCKCKRGFDLGHCFPDSFNEPRTGLKGMISGGTKLLLGLHGFVIQNISRITIGNDYQCLLKQINDSVIRIQTTGAQRSDLQSALPIWVCLERTKGAVSCLVTNLDFTYFPDPVVYSISPRKTIEHGGITQTVIGENLDLATFPYITVYSVQQTDTMAVITYNYNTTPYNEPGDVVCRTVNSTMLTCLTMKLYGLTIETSEYRRYIGISLDINLYNDYKNCLIPCDFTLWHNPTIEPWDEPRAYPVYDGKKTIDIRGPNFLTGCPEHEYRVEVSGIPCEIVSVIQNVITFYPPEITDYTKLQPTELHVGAYYVLTVGRLKYYKNWIDDPKNRNPLIGGLVGGIGGSILLAVIIILIVCYRKRRAKAGLLEYEPRYTRTPGEMSGPLTEYLSTDVKAQVDKYTVPFERIELVHELGKGNFGKVFKGTLVDKSGVKQPVAIKSLHGHHDMKDRVEFVEEAILMADFCHKHVLSLIAIVIEQNVPYVVLPLMDLGDLRTYISKDRNSFTVGNLVNFSLEVAEGMEYLASRKFVHRDLAARNCMINKDLLVKVADFGLARDIFEKDYYRAKDTQRPLPVKWMAIECLSSNTEFTEKSDVWSYGVLVWELMTRGKRPYSDVDNLDLKRFLLQGRRLEKPPVAPDFVYDLMLRCWLPDKKDRPRFKEIVKELKEILSAAESSETRVPSVSPEEMDADIAEPRVSYLQLSGNPPH